MDKDTLERSETLLTEEIQQIDPTEIIEGILSLNIYPITSQEPNPVKYFLGSGIKILVSDIIDPKIAQQSLKYPKEKQYKPRKTDLKA